MFTYVINTSENRTFDNDLLFRLSGYNKIRWMEKRLDKIGDCVKEIVDRQRVLGADDFRVAVIIDFYAFDKIRLPYGRLGYGDEKGVDMSIYLPYIEAFLVDNFIDVLLKGEVSPTDFEVYYAHGGEHNTFSQIDNEREQLRLILSGNKDTQHDVLKKDADKKQRLEAELSDAVKRVENYDDLSDSLRDAKVEEIIRADKTKELEKLQKELDNAKNIPLNDKSGADDKKSAVAKKKENNLESIMLRIDQLKEDLADLRTTKERISDLIPYERFSLYCTEDVYLELKIDAYPYGTAHRFMSFEDFFDAFKRRSGLFSQIRRHFYQTSLGGGAARSAFDTLSLSLYLIHLYEREEDSPSEALEIERLKPSVLKEVLVTAWGKVAIARNVALVNQSQYYSLNLTKNNLVEDQEELPIKDAIREEKSKLPPEIVNKKMSVDQTCREISRYVSKQAQGFSEQDRKEFDQMMTAYLDKRDDTRETDYVVETENFVNNNVQLTDRCPSEAEFEHVLHTRRENLSKLFEKTLKAEYIQVDFTDEKERADAAYNDYCKAKSCMSRNIIGDVVFLILVLLTMFVPYQVLQLKGSNLAFYQSLPLIGTLCAVFGGLFVLAFILQMLPLARKLERAKGRLRECYLDCCAKKNYSFSALKQRYEVDLVSIEEERYELRQIKKLYEANKLKEKHVILHRDMLEDVQDRLSSMLNNLDVEPIYNPNESVKDELDISKSFLSSENKIYHVFSIETIEKMFADSRGNKQ